jgi:uncharacterized lipoprotein NlpE involved in copper resistance
MKKLIFIIPALCIVLVACNNSENKTAETPGTKTMQADSVKQADSLEKEVMDGHNVGMARMSKMSKLQQEARRLIDSLDKLPAKAKEAARPYRGKLESLVNNLEDAKASMNKWMEEFRYDSARNDLEKRIKYLGEQTIKVSKVKEAILGSLQEADSLIKSKF